MKRLKFFILVFLISMTSVLTAQTFEIRVVNKGSGSLGVEMRETSTPSPTTSDAFLDLKFGIRWDTAYGINLGNASGSYNVGKAGGESISGAFEYQAFGLSSAPAYMPVDWTTNDWVEIASFSAIVNGGGTGDFEICPLNFHTTTDMNVNVSGTDYYPANGFEINGAATLVALGTNKTWNGNSGTSWFTAGNWTPSGVPTQYQGATIPGSLTDYPILTSDVNIKQLEIASGATLSLNGHHLHIRGELSGAGEIIGSTTSSLTFSGTGSSSLTMDDATPGTSNALSNLTISTSGTVTLSNAVEIFNLVTLTSGTLASGGNLRLGATASNAYAQIDPSGNGTITGNVTMEKFLKNTNAGWRHFYMPLNGTLAGFSGIDLKVTNPENVMYWDASIATGNKAKGWLVGATTDGRSKGGYTIYSDNTAGGDYDISQTINYTGTYSSGNVNFTLHENTEDPNGSGTVAEGWHLIGNPYPSNLNLGSMFSDWASNGALDYKAIHVWDAVNGQYKAFLDGVTIVNYGSPVAAGADSNVIAPFQAFWVKAAVGETTFTVEDGHRTTSMTNVGFFMKKNYDLLRMDVIGANGRWDQTVVYFHENGSTSFDNGLDAYKLISMNADVPSLYAVGPEGKFSISALNTNDYIHSVPLGFSSNVHGQTSFSLNIDELDAKWFVYLEDKELGIFYNIKDKPYTFNHTQNSDSRFVLHFQTYGLSAEKLVADIQNMSIGGDGTAIYVFVPAFYKDQNYQLEVIDMAGRVVYTDTKLAMTPGMNTLLLNLNANAYYAVRIKAAEGIASGKVQIR